MVATVLAASLALMIDSGPAGAMDTSVLEAERMLYPKSGKVVSDDTANNGKALLLRSNGTASGSIGGSVEKVIVSARGAQCNGAPRMVVRVDGVVAMTGRVSGSWTDYVTDTDLGSGVHSLRISFINDHNTNACSRNLRLDKTSFEYSSRAPYLFGLIGNDGTHLREKREVGIEAKLFSLSWRRFYSKEGVKDANYIAAKDEELKKLRGAGFEVILSLGYHDTPPWVHQNYRDTYYVDQYGDRWTGDTFAGGHPIDNGDANLVFNRRLRELVASYIKDVFAEFGSNFYAIRLGGGRYGELTYPPASYGGHVNCYWAYDENAQVNSPVPSWEPGDPSPDGEASRFLDWYLDSLVEYQNWQISALRENYEGPIMMLYPSWGIRPGQAKQAVASNLAGTTPAERNGEIQRGYDFARQIAAITDPEVIVTTTWLDANIDIAADDRDDPRYWSPVKYLSELAHDHPLHLKVYGENTGRGKPAAMELSASQMHRYGLIGMAWYNEEELFSGRYATLEDYRRIIAAYKGTTQ